MNHDNKTDDCLPCPDSLFSKVGDQGCSACAAGQTAGIVSCENCLPGQVSSSKTNLECEDCKVGYYQNEKGLPSCIRCIPGKYTNKRTKNNNSIYSNALNINYYHFLLVFSQVNIRMKLEKQTAQNVALVSIVHVLIPI